MRINIYCLLCFAGVDVGRGWQLQFVIVRQQSHPKCETHCLSWHVIIVYTPDATAGV